MTRSNVAASPPSNGTVHIEEEDAAQSTLEARVRARIEELKEARTRYHREAEQQLSAFAAVIGELEKLLGE